MLKILPNFGLSRVNMEINFIILDLTVPRERYNYSLKRTRSSVERMFGLWKKRFPCLSKGLGIDIDTTMMVIMATAVLHNIAIMLREQQFPDEKIINYRKDTIALGYTKDGTKVRDEIVKKYFT